MCIPPTELVSTILVSIEILAKDKMAFNNEKKVTKTPHRYEYFYYILYLHADGKGIKFPTFFCLFFLWQNQKQGTLIIRRERAKRFYFFLYNLIAQYNQTSNIYIDSILIRIISNKQ